MENASKNEHPIETGPSEINASGVQMTSDVVVLMTVYNGGSYLRTAIDSILQQTYRDFKFLIVDDASTDDSRAVVDSYDDDRIEVLNLEQNVGQTAALNIGLRHGSETWIARMDADDYSAPTRLEEQMRELEADDSLDVLGTQAWTFSGDPDWVVGQFGIPLNHSDIERQSLRGSPIIHATIVAKRSALLAVGGYDERYRYSADIELYDRLMGDYTLANLPAKLYGIRHHSARGTITNVAQNETIEIFSRKLQRRRFTPKEREIVLSSLCRFHIVLSHKLAGQVKLVEMSRNLWRGLRASPKTFAWFFPLLFVAYTIPERVRARLRKVLVQFKSKAIPSH